MAGGVSGISFMTGAPGVCIQRRNPDGRREDPCARVPLIFYPGPMMRDKKNASRVARHTLSENIRNGCLQIPKAIGFMYTLVMIGVIAYLWYSGRWRQKLGWLLLVISAFLGFLIFSPVAPWQFQQLVLRDVQGLGAPLIVGVIGLFVVLVLTFVFGRFFCGYLCPVGTVQEIASHAPVPKVNLRQKKMFMVIRAAFFIVFLVMAFLFSASFLAYFGIQGFLLPRVQCRCRGLYRDTVAVHDLLSPVLPPYLPLRGPVIARCLERPVQTPENRCLY